MHFLLNPKRRFYKKKVSVLNELFKTFSLLQFFFRELHENNCINKLTFFHSIQFEKLKMLRQSVAT